MNPGLVLAAGVTHCVLDLRQCLGWSETTSPELCFEGYGTAKIKNVTVARIPPGANVKGLLNAARFWMPEQMRHSTINMLSPVFWDGFTRPVLDVALGLRVCGFLCALRGGLCLSAQPAPRACAGAGLPGLGPRLPGPIPAALLSAAQQEHCAQHQREDRRNYTIAPQLGEFLPPRPASGSRPARPLLVQVLNWDWFSPLTLAFNLVPRRCGLYLQENGKYGGIMMLTEIDKREADYFVSYFGASAPPAGFKIVYSQSPSVFIARKE